MKKYTNEFKVGLFVVLCLIGLFYLTYSTGKLDMKKKGYYIYAIFNDIAGLEKKAPVRLNGMEVGKVDDIKITYNNAKTQIMLKIWLQDQVKLRVKPVISIKTMGLMGEKYVQIASTEGNDFIKPDVTLYGEDPADLEAMMADLRATMGNNKESINNIVKNFEEFSDDIKRHPWKLLFKTKEQPKKESTFKKEAK